MDSAAAFFPWRDDLLLPEESVYSVWNKICWFAVDTPIAVIRASRCRGPTVVPRTIDYNAASKWLDLIASGSVLPTVQGRGAQDYLLQTAIRDTEVVPAHWRSRRLRFCPECIQHGMHLRLHQHLALDRCPFHKTMLLRHCPHCGAELPYTSVHRQPAFGCAACRRSFLPYDGSGLAPSSWTKYYVRQACEDLYVWLHRVRNAPVLISGLDGRYAKDGEHLYDLTAAALHLEAAAQKALHRPAALRTNCLHGARIEEVPLPTSLTIDRNLSPKKLHALRYAQTRLPRHGAAIALRRYVDSTLSIYVAAMQRVVQRFLRTYQRGHYVCLNAPLLIQGELSRQTYWRGSPMHRELFECCPVGLGFWAWRHRFASIHARQSYCPMQSEVGLHVLLHDTRALGRLFEDLGWSLLNAAFVMSISVADTAQSKGVQQASDELVTWLLHSEFLHMDGVDAQSWVRIEASDALRASPCSGTAPYRNWLARQIGERKCSSAPNDSANTYSKAAWTRRCPPYRSHFLPMKHDRLLMPEWDGPMATPD